MLCFHLCKSLQLHLRFHFLLAVCQKVALRTFLQSVFFGLNVCNHSKWSQFKIDLKYKEIKRDKDRDGQFALLLVFASRCQNMKKTRSLASLFCTFTVSALPQSCAEMRNCDDGKTRSIEAPGRLAPARSGGRALDLLSSTTARLLPPQTFLSPLPPTQLR